jgi:YhcH/YjgK/YiaL family protein
MILDTLDQAARYAGMHPGFARAFEYLADATLVEREPGKHELDGQRLFVIISHDPGRGRHAAKLESHRRYIDIQYVLRGTDEMGWRPLASCKTVETPYDAQREVAFYADAPETWIRVLAGQFVIFWPDDAHAPLAAQGELTKAVMKIAIDW